jgi:TolB-like protein
MTAAGRIVAGITRSPRDGVKMATYLGVTSMKHGSRRNRLLLLLATAFVMNPSAALARPAPERPTVAILPFTSPTRWNAMGRNAQETFVTALVKTKRVRVIQASMVQRMLRRHGLRWTGVVEPRLLKAAGRWLKADYLLAGKLRWSGDAYTLSAHAMDVKTLETSVADDVDFSNARKMRLAVRLMARKMGAQLSGGRAREQGHEMFLNVDARAFYDTADACGRVLRRSLARYRFSGQISAVDEQQRTVTAKGYAGRLERGVPLDVLDTSAIDGPTAVATIYVTQTSRGSVIGAYRQPPSDGVPLSGTVTSDGHRWVIAVATLQDEAAGDEN